jgi:hypothetical protein
MRKRLAALEAEHAPKVAALRRDMAVLETQIKMAVIKHGASVKGETLQAVYQSGKATWDDHALQGFALHHEAILAFRRVGKPSVSIRTVRPAQAAS